MLTHGIPPDFRDDVHIYHPPPSGQSRFNRVTQLRTDGVPFLESAGTEPGVLEGVPVMGTARSGITMDQLMRTYLSPHPLLILLCNVCSGYGDMLMCKTENIGGGHTQAESGAYSRDSSRFPRRCPLVYTVNRHRVSPEFIRSRNCVPMAFTAESPPAKGQIVLK